MLLSAARTSVELRGVCTLYCASAARIVTLTVNVILRFYDVPALAHYVKEIAGSGVLRGDVIGRMVAPAIARKLVGWLKIGCALIYDLNKVVVTVGSYGDDDLRLVAIHDYLTANLQPL